jgi:uncharacterized protein YrzB (UPF0473 family)
MRINLPQAGKRYQMEHLENDDMEMTVSMVLEDGTELECVVLAKFPVNDKEYLALLPDVVVDGYEEGDVWLYQVKELENDELELIPIEDEEEYEQVADAFDELLDEEEFNNLDQTE